VDQCVSNDVARMSIIQLSNCARETKQNKVSQTYEESKIKIKMLPFHMQKSGIIFYQSIQLLINNHQFVDLLGKNLKDKG